MGFGPEVLLEALKQALNLKTHSSRAVRNGSTFLCHFVVSGAIIGN